MDKKSKINSDIQSVRNKYREYTYWTTDPYTRIRSDVEDHADSALDRRGAKFLERNIETFVTEAINRAL